MVIRKNIITEPVNHHLKTRQQPKTCVQLFAQIIGCQRFSLHYFKNRTPRLVLGYQELCIKALHNRTLTQGKPVQKPETVQNRSFFFYFGNLSCKLNHWQPRTRVWPPYCFELVVTKFKLNTIYYILVMELSTKRLTPLTYLYYLRIPFLTVSPCLV